MPLHMEWVAGKTLKNEQRTRKKCLKLRLGAKKKSSFSYGIISATISLILTKHVFCVYSVLHLLPQREVTQHIFLTIYVGTTQQSPVRV